MALAAGCGKTAQVESGNTAQVEQGNPGGRPGMFRQRSPEETKTLLAPLVKDGIITQQQADSVVAGRVTQVIKISVNGGGKIH